MLRTINVLFSFLLSLIPATVFAHEAYVLSGEQYARASMDRSFSFGDALYYSENGVLFFSIAGAVSLLLIVNFLFRHSQFGRFLDDGLEKLAWVGPLIIRLSLAFTFFFSGTYGVFFGPELPLSSFAGGEGMQLLFIVLSGLLFVGLWTEFAALLGAILFFMGMMQIGGYSLLYAPVIGACAILFFWGSPRWSLDAFLGEKKKINPDSFMLAPVIVRFFFGTMLVYSALAIKVLHPAITIAVVEKYRLTQVPLFANLDPLMLVFLFALVEFFMGVFIIAGFEMRLTVFFSLVVTTLSLIFFRELLMPHILLYGTALALFVSHDDRFTIDTFFDNHGIFRIQKKRRTRTYFRVAPIVRS